MCSVVYEHVRDANMIEPPNKFGAVRAKRGGAWNRPEGGATASSWLGGQNLELVR